jgi:uncharacterized protein YebE (UPF0316 family)
MFESWIFLWIALPVLIFLARIVDVSLGTIRVIYVMRGMKHIAPIVGFFEILVWIFAVGSVIRNLENWVCALAFAAGFAAGNYVGIKVESLLSIGHVVIRVITKKEAHDLVWELRNAGFGVTHSDAEGTTGPVHIVYTVIKRECIHAVISIIQKCNPQAFYSIEDVRYVREGVFPARANGRREKIFRIFAPHRKSK